MIFLAIAAGLLLLLLIPLPGEIVIRNGKLTVSLRILGLIKIPLYPKREKKKPKAAKNAAPAEKKDEPESPTAVLDTLKTHKDTLRTLIRGVPRILRTVKVGKLYLHVTVGGADPAETAMVYGAVCAAVYPALATLAGLMHFYPDAKAHSVRIAPDYDAPTCRLHLSARLSAVPLRLLAASAGTLWDLVKPGARGQTAASS